MESLSRLGKRIRDVLSWRSESKKRKEIAKEMILETEKSEAEKLYWLMISCIEFAENIQENLQASTDNPVVLGDAKVWIKTQVDIIRASWWPRRYQHIPGIFSLSNAYTPYILENLSESSFAAVKSLSDLVNYTNKKVIEFRYPRFQVPRRINVFKRFFCCIAK